jgi:DNA-binding NtrC family response regulator
LLVLHFLEFYKEKTGRFVSGISKEAMSALVNYEWPGNVRELENAIERAIIIASGRQIEAEDLPEAIAKKALENSAQTRQERLRASSEGRSVGLAIEVPSTLGEIERMLIEATLEYAAGDKTRASKLLGIGRKTLYRKLDEYNVKVGSE